jgi:hypothetical protein
MGERFFSKIYYAKEVTRGTALPATKQFIGGEVSAITSDRKPRVVEENIGVRASGSRMVHDQLLVSESLNISEGYFQCLPALFGCGLKGGVTATETTGGQGDYLWDFTPSLVSGVANAPDSLTIEKGDDTQAFECEYTMFERIKISGSVAQGADAAAVSIEAQYFARQWTSTTFTGAISIPAVTPMNAKLARFYLDTSWANVGTTEKTNILRKFDIDILTGVHPAFSGSAYKYFNKHKEGLISAQMSLTIEGDSDANAINTLFRTDPQALAVACIKINGPQIGTGTSHNLTLAVGGMFEDVTALAENDRGNNLHTFVVNSLYDATGAKSVYSRVTTNSNAY